LSGAMVYFFCGVEVNTTGEGGTYGTIKRMGLEKCRTG